MTCDLTSAVEYRVGQDPQLLQSAPYCGGGEAGSRVALAPDGCTVAVSARADVQLFSAETGDLMATLSALHTGQWRETGCCRHRGVMM